MEAPFTTAKQEGLGSFGTEEATFALQDILTEWGIWDLLKHAYGAENLGEKPPDTMPWQCQMCPTATNEAELLEWLHEGVPCFLSQDHAADVYERSGPDALKFVTDKRWNSFPKPRIAFKSGWGQPGTPISDYERLALVNSFEDVLKSKEVLNLQMFHRKGSEEPKLPCLPLHLRWPMPDVFGDQARDVLEGEAFKGEKQQALQGGRHSQHVGAGVVVDAEVRLLTK